MVGRNCSFVAVLLGYLLSKSECRIPGDVGNLERLLQGGKGGGNGRESEIIKLRSGNVQGAKEGGQNEANEGMPDLINWFICLLVLRMKTHFTRQHVAISRWHITMYAMNSWVSDEYLLSSLACMK